MIIPCPMLHGRSVGCSLRGALELSNIRSSLVSTNCTLSIPRRKSLHGVCATLKRLPAGWQSCCRDRVELVLLLHPGCPTLCTLEIRMQVWRVRRRHFARRRLSRRVESLLWQSIIAYCSYTAVQPGRMTLCASRRMYLPGKPPGAKDDRNVGAEIWLLLRFAAQCHSFALRGIAASESG